MGQSTPHTLGALRVYCAIVERPATRPAHTRCLSAAASPHAPVWLGILALLIFGVFAANFLYFFVDDEGIPFVYAQNLLKGRGLSYTSLEGPVEGYSDFLHVTLCAGILAGVHAVRAPKLWVFFIGKAWSFACGAAVVWTVFLALRALVRTRPAVLAGLALIATAGPLAVWSCSSLEAVPFSLTITVLAWGLVPREGERDGIAALAAATAVLLRVDGFVYVGAIVASVIAFSTPARRSAVARRIIVPVALVLVTYHSWRLWYFPDWLPTPIAAKVLYKLLPDERLLVKAPERAYLARFVGLDGAWFAALVGAAALWAARRSTRARVLLAAAAIMVAYVSVVGDWMFGFRFLLPVLPLVAMLVAIAIDRLSVRHATVAGAAALAVVTWCGVRTQAFITSYSEAQNAPSFLHHPGSDRRMYFRPYYATLEMTLPHVTPGTVIADNQAGFVPFMLDAQNIDDLGICSRFHARLPTTDVYFTEVGRYSPLPVRGPIGASEAYFLYHDARFLLERLDLLRSAHRGSIPETLLDGYFRLIAQDEAGSTALYARTDKPGDAYTSDPTLFRENLSHVSAVRGVIANAERLDAKRARTLAFLRAGSTSFAFTGRYTLQLLIGDADARVFSLDVAAIRSTAPITVEFSLQEPHGAPMARQAIQVPSDATTGLRFDTPPGIPASVVNIDLIAQRDGPVRVELVDLRTSGQTARLARYIERMLVFPRPRQSGRPAFMPPPSVPPQRRETSADVINGASERASSSSPAAVRWMPSARNRSRDERVASKMAAVSQRLAPESFATARVAFKYSACSATSSASDRTCR